MVIGLDPGVKGGIACIDGGLYAAKPLPMIGKDVDLKAVMQILEGWGKADLAVIEHQAGRFCSPMSYGMIYGACFALGIPILCPTPNKWHKELLGKVAKGMTKEESISYALKRFPLVDLKPGNMRNYHDGMADALCLADWGVKQILSAA